MGEEELEWLLTGNKRFYSDGPQPDNTGSIRRLELIDGQNPFAAIVSCSDSRVSPEYIFNVGLGDIFVMRSAGNGVHDASTLGSLEYAVKHLHVPLVMVMGHQNCGAVSAALEGQETEKNLQKLLKKFNPVVTALKSGSEQSDDTLKGAVIENIKYNTGLILKESNLIKRYEDEKKVKIVGAYYSFESGKVEIIDGN